MARAPERRIDNLLTHTHDGAALLRMHARVLEEARKEYVGAMWRWRGVCATMLAAAPLGATAGVMQDLIAMTTGGGIAAGGVLAAGLVALQMNFTLTRLRAELLSDGGLDARFERCHV